MPEVDSTSILDLPAELHISIAQHLAIRPRDLLSVLKTCRALNRVYSQKCIWDDALRIVCQRDALFVPSYPIQSMTVVQLQRAAMGSDLWNSRLRAGKPFVDADVQAKVTTPNDDGTRRGGRDPMARPYLVPGGRYLFEQAEVSISLWDLGLPVALTPGVDAFLKPNITLIDRIMLQVTAERPVVEFVVHPSADGERLRLWIATTPSPNARHMSKLSIYEFRPLDAKPKLQEISSIDATVSSLFASHCDLAMTTKLAIIHTYERVFIWDFMSDSYTVWHINQTPGPDDLISLSHNSIVVVKKWAVLSWDIPAELDFKVPTSRMIDLSHHFTLTRYPPHRMTYYDECNSHKPLAWTLSHWYNSLNLPTLFDVEEPPAPGQVESEESTTSTRSGPNLTRVSRYQLNIPPATVPTESQPSGRPNSTSPSRLEHLETFPLPLTPDTYPFLHRISGDILLSFFNDCKPGYHFGLVYSPFSASPHYPELRAKRLVGKELREGEDYGIVGMNLDPEGAKSNWLTFCSASGRVVCSLVNFPGPAKNSIKVFDFSRILVR